MIEMGKKYKTRGGEDVRVFATDGSHPEYPVVGLLGVGSTERPVTWTRSGQFVLGQTNNNDLVEVKPRIKRTGWVNVYGEPNRVGIGASAIYVDKSLADLYAKHDRIACVKIEIDCEHGRGL